MNRQQRKMVELINEQGLSLESLSPIGDFTVPTDVQLKTYMLWSARRYFYQQRNYTQNRSWLDMRQVISPIQQYEEHNAYNPSGIFTNDFHQWTISNAQNRIEEVAQRVSDAIETYGSNAWSTLNLSDSVGTQHLVVYPRTYGLLWMWSDSKDRPINTNVERGLHYYVNPRLGTRDWLEPQRRSINILMVGGKVFQRLGMYKYYNNGDVEYISDQKTLLESPEGKALSDLYNTVSAEVHMRNGLKMRVGRLQETNTTTEVSQ